MTINTTATIRLPMPEGFTWTNADPMPVPVTWGIGGPVVGYLGEAHWEETGRLRGQLGTAFDHELLVDVHLRAGVLELLQDEVLRDVSIAPTRDPQDDPQSVDNTRQLRRADRAPGLGEDALWLANDDRQPFDFPLGRRHPVTSLFNQAALIGELIHDLVWYPRPRVVRRPDGRAGTADLVWYPRPRVVRRPDGRAGTAR